MEHFMQSRANTVQKKNIFQKIIVKKKNKINFAEKQKFKIIK